MPDFIHMPEPDKLCTKCGVTSPICHCLSCRLYEREEGIPRPLCSPCCNRRFPPEQVSKKKISCQRCGNFLKPFKPPKVGTITPKTIERCNCCDWADLCVLCCPLYYHNCCQAPIRFVGTNPEPLFLFPIVASHPTNTINAFIGGGRATPQWANVGILHRTAALTVLGKTMPYTMLWRKGFLTNPSHRFASVEIEVSKYRLGSVINKAVNNWLCGVVRDTSVGDNGFEINSTPACGDVLLAQIRDLCTALDQGQATVNTSCGLHVHVDARDFGYQDIQKLVRIYKEIEPVLFMATHYSRADNTYCNKCGDRFYNKFIKGVKPKTKELKQKIMAAVYPEATEGSLDKKGDFTKETARAVRSSARAHYGDGDHRLRNTPRYYALNLHSYFLRGTIEFRLHHGSTKYWEIAGWTRILLELFDSIHRMSEAQIAETLFISNQQTKDILRQLPIDDWVRPTYTPDQAAHGLAVLRQLLPKNEYLDLRKRVVFHSINRTPQLPSAYVSDETWVEEMEDRMEEDNE